MSIFDGITAPATAIVQADAIAAETAARVAADLALTAADAAEVIARDAALLLKASLSGASFTGAVFGLTAPTGTSTTQLATTAFATSQDFGAGQSWQAVTRLAGVTYTNGTGKPITLEIKQSSGAAPADITMTIAGVSAGYASSVAGVAACLGSYVIPDGASYSYTTTAANLVFKELR